MGKVRITKRDFARNQKYKYRIKKLQEQKDKISTMKITLGVIGLFLFGAMNAYNSINNTNSKELENTKYNLDNSINIKQPIRPIEFIDKNGTRTGLQENTTIQTRNNYLDLNNDISYSNIDLLANTIETLKNKINVSISNSMHGFSQENANNNENNYCTCNVKTQNNKIPIGEITKFAPGLMLYSYKLKNGEKLTLLSDDEKTILTNNTIAELDHELKNPLLYFEFMPQNGDLKINLENSFTTNVNLSKKITEAEFCKKAKDILAVNTLANIDQNCEIDNGFSVTESSVFSDCILTNKLKSSNITEHHIHYNEIFSYDNFNEKREKLFNWLVSNKILKNNIKAIEKNEMFTVSCSIKKFLSPTESIATGHVVSVVIGKDNRGKIIYVVLDPDKHFSKKDYFEMENFKISKNNPRNIYFATTGMEVKDSSTCVFLAFFTRKFIDYFYGKNFSAFFGSAKNGSFAKNMIEVMNKNQDLIDAGVFKTDYLEKAIKEISDQNVMGL